MTLRKRSAGKTRIMVGAARRPQRHAAARDAGRFAAVFIRVRQGDADVAMHNRKALTILVRSFKNRHFRSA
jgi:hypothetical protein